MGLLLGFGFIAAFATAVRTGQFDDTETPAMRIFDDEIEIEIENENTISPQTGDEMTKGAR